MDPVSITLGALAFISAVGGSIAGAVQMGNLRKLQQAMQMLNEQVQTQASIQSINNQEQSDINTILLNAAVNYKKAQILISEKNKKENEVLALFSGSVILAAIGIRIFIKKEIK